MKIHNDIRNILADEKLDLGDKLIAIEALLPKEQPVELVELFGSPCKVTRKNGGIIYDGSYGEDYTDNPRLANHRDIYYEGCGCTWGTDLDGKRYWKLFDAGNSKYYDKYPHLDHMDIINNTARNKKLIKECLNEMGY